MKKDLFGLLSKIFKTFFLELLAITSIIFTANVFVALGSSWESMIFCALTVIYFKIGRKI